MGLNLLFALESIRTPLLNYVFMFFHHIGNLPAYLIIVPATCFLLPKHSRALLVAVLGSWGVNSAIKISVALPRPFVHSDLTPVIAHDSFSFPSGHAQAAAVFWVFLALSIRKPWMTALSIFMIFMIGLSRLYLGVHYPTDVLVGWAVGAAIATFVWKNRGRFGSETTAAARN